ncbi:MAG: DUF192 domain-containing protein [Candidatus Aminicenantes bacterium]|nr:DUF192 domain-containing protein [Candidatus Aminicenantes bacterium]
MKNKILLITMLAIVFSNLFSGSGFTTIFLGDEEFVVEIAETNREKALGLMYRKEIPDNFGMLFIYSNEDFRGMWMKNTLVNLDLIFLNSQKEIVEIIHNVPPCVKDPCKSYISEKKAKYVLELKGNRSKKLNLNEGDRIFFIL